MLRMRTASSKFLVPLGSSHSMTAIAFCIVFQAALLIAFALCRPVPVEDTTPSEVREPFPSPHRQQRVSAPLDLKVKSHQRGRGSLLLAGGSCSLLSVPPGEARCTWSTDTGSESEFPVDSDEEDTRNKNKPSLTKKSFQDSIKGTANVKVENRVMRECKS